MITSSSSERSSSFLSLFGRGGVPYTHEIGPQRLYGVSFFQAQLPRSRLFTAVQLALYLFKLTQTLLPFGLQSAGNQSILGLHSLIATLGTVGLIACPLDGQAPLCKCSVMV